MSSTPLLPNLNHFISLTEAKEMTARYRAEKENILLLEHRNKNILSICETFNRAEFDTVLTQEGCVALRVYFGMNPDLKIRVIVVGVNDKNEDILPPSRAASSSSPEGTEDDGDDDEGIIQAGQPCPEFCPNPPL